MPVLFINLLFIISNLTQTAANVAFGGVNLAGFDFGETTDGYYTLETAGQQMINSGSAMGQLVHFVSEGLNAFRLPVSWQYIASDPGTLDEGMWGEYNNLVQDCLDAGAQLCIIDIYARWNGQIIGQGGPSNEQFANFWAQLAAKYVGDDRVAFDIMNEPHDLDINMWAETSQAVVNAIRGVGAANIIMLQGNDYSSAGAFLTASTAMLTVQNPDANMGCGNLIFDVHQYLNSDFTGDSPECVQDGSAIFQQLGDWLRAVHRQAFVGEIGGGNGDDCISLICGAFDTIKYVLSIVQEESDEGNSSYSDVYLGVTTWSAGAFDSSYIFSETPAYNEVDLTDTLLVTSCVITKLGDH